MIKYLRHESQKVLEEVIDKKVIPVIQQAILDEVYAKYTPSGENPYERRGEHGGLADPKWLEQGKTITTGENFVKINVRSIAPRNGDNYWVHNGYMLDAIIVEGDKYTWKNSKIYWQQPFPRDFYEVAREVMRDKLPKLIQKEFKKRGIDCNFKVTIN